MKFANLVIKGNIHPCIEVPGGYLDIVYCGKAANTLVPQSMRELIETGIVQGTKEGNELKAVLERFVDGAAKGSFSPITPQQIGPELLGRFAPAIENPGKILCIGLNYAQHVEECHHLTGQDVADAIEFPSVFGKFNNALAASGESVRLMRSVGEYDYEAELAVVIGMRAKDVTVENANSYVFGYTCANDLTSRELQRRSTQWFLGKSPDHFCPLGPVIVTADEFDCSDVAITCRVNGEKRQSDRTSHMVRTVPELVSYLSTYITLEPGDVILTGTPSGVNMGRPEDEQHWLAAGDQVEVEIEGIGTLVTPLK